MSRADVRWDPKFCSTAPGQDPPSLTHQISPWGGQVLRVREQGSRCEGSPASGGGWESVHRTTIAMLDEQSRCQVGPKILFDRPRPGSPVPHPSDFPVGRAGAEGEGAGVEMRG